MSFLGQLGVAAGSNAIGGMVNNKNQKAAQKDAMNNAASLQAQQMANVEQLYGQQQAYEQQQQEALRQAIHAMGGTNPYLALAKSALPTLQDPVAGMTGPSGMFGAPPPSATAGSHHGRAYVMPTVAPGDPTLPPGAVAPPPLHVLPTPPRHTL